MSRLEDPATIDTAVYAAALEAERAVRPDVAVELVTAFGSKRTSAETFALAAALRSRRAAGLGDYADLLIGRIYACRPASEIVALLHQHAEDPAELDADTVLVLLTEQPDEVAADVCAVLRVMKNCRECQAISRRFDERILTIWPESRRIGLLSALHLPIGP